MISCIQRHISCLSGKLCGWLLKDLHYQQLYSELHSLEVWAFFLQFAVVHIHRVELILFIGTQFVPWLWVVLSVPADIWIKQCQAHHIQCCSSTPLGCFLACPRIWRSMFAAQAYLHAERRLGHTLSRFCNLAERTSKVTQDLLSSCR